MKAMWQNPILTATSPYFPLAPCRKIFDYEQLSNILQVLPNVFRVLSLETTYKDSPISAQCVSLEKVEFTVSLFESIDPNAPGIILEIQCQSAATIIFHRIAQKIFTTLSQDGDVPSVDDEQTELYSWNVPGFKLMETMLQKMDTIPRNDPTAVIHAMEQTETMLGNERYDSNRLGLESLIHMTNPTVSGWFTAKAASSFLLNPTDKIQTFLSNTLINFVTGNAVPTTTIQPYEPEFQYLSLVVLSQVFRMAAADSLAKTDLYRFIRSCPTNFVPCILQKLLEAQNHPNHAYFAILCLTELSSTLPQLRTQVSNAAVEEAQRFGDANHLALANASHRLLIALQA